MISVVSATPFSPGRRVCPLHSISDEPQVSFCMGVRLSFFFPSSLLLFVLRLFL